MKVELENILDIGTELYSLDENFKIKRKVVVNIRSIFEQDTNHLPRIHTTGVCRKPAIEGSEYCREHKEYMEERQCQR